MLGSVCVCVCACVRACVRVRAHVRVCSNESVSGLARLTIPIQIEDSILYLSSLLHMATFYTVLESMHQRPKRKTGFTKSVNVVSKVCTKKPSCLFLSPWKLQNNLGVEKYFLMSVIVTSMYPMGVGNGYSLSRLSSSRNLPAFPLDGGKKRP